MLGMNNKPLNGRPISQIKVRPSVREVVAIYTIDEGSMELVVQLPINFPLGPVNVDSGKKVGVTASQWRTWMLQLTTFLQVIFKCTSCWRAQNTLEIPL